MDTHTRIMELCIAMAVGLVAVGGTASAADQYVVHEWGTFTVLQDEAGNALPGVNVNEESLPPFVHRLSHRLLPDGGELSPFRRWYSKGIPSSYPAALMRMETPVIYIYPPDGKAGERLDVSVSFRGGWVSEWYPDASVAAPGFDPNHSVLGNMAAETEGSIQWSGLSFGANKTLPDTDAHVWNAPRQVSAPIVSTASGQSERYLFYRGIANIEAPLRVTSNSMRTTLSVHANSSEQDLASDSMKFNRIWLVDIRDGQVAFREMASLDASATDTALAEFPAKFNASEYSPANRKRLRSSMKQALLAEGLLDDEAEAMLNTWKLSYFQSSGLRLFFTLPRAWTDQVLPLTVSQTAHVVRAMIGRIEIVTDEQRDLLKQLASCEISSGDWLPKELEKLAPVARADFWSQVLSGGRPLQDFGLRVPEDYQLYIQLGRFRDALVLNELERRPTAALHEFVKNNRLHFDASTVSSKSSPRPSRPAQEE